MHGHFDFSNYSNPASHHHLTCATGWRQRVSYDLPSFFSTNFNNNLVDNDHRRRHPYSRATIAAQLRMLGAATMQPSDSAGLSLTLCALQIYLLTYVQNVASSQTMCAFISDQMALACSLSNHFGPNLPLLLKLQWIRSVDFQENNQHCCHILGPRLKCTNSISAEVPPQTPLGELTTLLRGEGEGKRRDEKVRTE